MKFNIKTSKIKSELIVLKNEFIEKIELIFFKYEFIIESDFV